MSNENIQLEQSFAENAAYWAAVNRLRIDGQPFDLTGRKYQLEIMSPVTKDGKTKTNEVIRKGSQIGVTMIKVIEIVHGALYGIYRQGVIYYFPSGRAVEHFSKTRFKPFLDDNEKIRRLVNDVNAVAVRRIGGTNVNFFGCSATSIIGGEAKDATTVRSTPADWILLDERDLFDDEMAGQVNQRLGNSKIARRTDIGTPKLPEDGIDLIYKKSDMRRWQIRCDKCGKHTCLETEFPNAIKIDSANGEAYPVCIHCGELIYRTNGEWIPDSPEKDTVGYWASQLLNPNKSLSRILKEYRDPEAFGSNLVEFYRTVLGMPYAEAADKLSESDVLACCCGDAMAYSHTGPCAMGVDVGKTIHVVIGYRINRDRFRVIKLARVSDWPSLHDLIGRFNVKSVVIDAYPELHKAREFQKSEPTAVYLCYYSEHIKTFDHWGEDNIIKVNRTEIFDTTHRMTTQPGLLMIPRHCEEIAEFAHQMCMAAKIQETDARTGDSVYRYRKIGDKEDHYRNALNYFFLACKKIGMVNSDPQILERRKTVMQEMSYRL